MELPRLLIEKWKLSPEVLGMAIDLYSRQIHQRLDVACGSANDDEGLPAGTFPKSQATFYRLELDLKIHGLLEMGGRKKNFIKQLIAEHPGIGRQELIRISGVSRATVDRALAEIRLNL